MADSDEDAGSSSGAEDDAGMSDGEAAAATRRLRSGTAAADAQVVMHSAPCLHAHP